jgi:hypothetical protein
MKATIRQLDEAIDGLFNADIQSLNWNCKSAPEKS